MSNKKVLFIFASALDKSAFSCYIILMRDEKEKYPNGTRVQHRTNGMRGTVVSEKCFGKCARPYNVMLQLECGLQYEVTPYALKKVI
jgi:hypothetical protein